MKKIILVLLFIFLMAAYGQCSSRSWQSRSSTHFLVYYNDAPSDFIDKIAEEAEDYYREITYDLGFNRQESWLSEDRAKIYIYNDADDYQKSTGQPAWTSGVTSYQEKTINTYPLAAGFFDTLLPHELGHIIFRESVGFTADVPIWLDEGVACFQEKSRRWGANKIVAKAITDKKFMSLDELAKLVPHAIQNNEIIELLYAESSSIVYFLIVEQGRYSFVKLCQELRSGKNLDESVNSAYIKYKNVKELNDAWVRYVKNE